MRSKLGQHFLTDKSIVTKIIDAADLSSRDTVLEVGPGKGILTRALVESGAYVIAVEKDGELHHKLKKRFKDVPNLKLIHADIRNFDLNSLPKKYKLVANIPYYLTGQLIPRFLEANNPPVVMVLMIQKEVADRLLAKPGASSILQLSVLVFATVDKVSDVPRTSFSPPPEVDSTVVKFILRPKPLLSSDERGSFFRLLKFAFAGRRKMLTNTLSAALNIPREHVAEALLACRANVMARPQELDIDKWLCLYQKLL